MRRIKYDRNDLTDVMVTARRIAAGNNLTLYVFATGYGYIIDQRPPPPGQAHYKVYPDHAELIRDIAELKG